MTYQIINRNATPLCFQSSRQFRAWKNMARLSPPQIQNWICTDCTHDYQQQMIAQGRCVQPKAKFVNKEGGAMWLTQDKFDKMEVRRIMKERRESAIRDAKARAEEAKAAVRNAKRAKEIMRSLQRAARGEI